jgi:hypothetical protein
VAKSATGRWVSRVGASGGGKAYKKTRPGNYYGAIALVVIFGLLAVVLARYDYQHPSKHHAGAEPRIGQTWYAGLSIQACGVRLGYLTNDATDKGAGLTVLPGDVIRISPTSASDSGANATVSQFAAEFPGLIASTTQLSVPKATGVANPATTYTNGKACPAGSKYAGQVGKVTYAYWTTFGQKNPTVTSNPTTIKFTNQMRVSMAFEPVNITPLPPTQKTANLMTAYATAPATTTTITTPVATTTTTLKSGTTTTTTPTTTTSKG